MSNRSFLFLALLLAAPGVTAADSKGVGGLAPDGEPPVRLEVNRPADAAPPPAADVDLRYRYGGAEGTGREAVLENGATLRSGDRFTIAAVAQRPLYLYLFQFDSHGELHELVSWSGHPNRLAAGERLLLPGDGESEGFFYLDDRPGSETIHTIVSRRPLEGLRDRYRHALDGDGYDPAAVQLYAAEHKGVLIGAAPASPRAGYSLQCLGPAGSCGVTFTIRHLAR